MLFQTGQIVQTATIANESKEDPIFAYNILNILNRYMNADWGDLGNEDKELNNNAIKNNNDRILAAYNVPNSKKETKKIYIITEYDRTITTILLADEY